MPNKRQEEYRFTDLAPILKARIQVQAVMQSLYKRSHSLRIRGLENCNWFAPQKTLVLKPLSEILWNGYSLVLP